MVWQEKATEAKNDKSGNRERKKFFQRTGETKEKREWEVCFCFPFQIYLLQLKAKGGRRGG